MKTAGRAITGAKSRITGNHREIQTRN